MTTFDRREEAFENQFAHDEELHFRAEARRNRMLATWAAGLMSKGHDETERYVADIVAAGVNGGGDSAIAARLRTDLEAAGHPVTERDILARLHQEMAAAMHYVRTV